MMRKQLFLIASVVGIVTILVNLTVLAQDSEEDSEQDSESAIVDTDLYKSRGTKVKIFPYAFYNPEVELAFGAGGLITFYTSEDPILRPSKFSLSGWYSTSKQYRVGF